MADAPGRAHEGPGSDLPRAEVAASDGCGRGLSAAEHTDRSVQLFRGAVVRTCAGSQSHCLLPQFPLASSPVLAPQPWDFPSVLPGAGVTHKTQGICPESPFFVPALGSQSLWGRGSPEQLNALSCSLSLILCLFPTEGSSQINMRLRTVHVPVFAHLQRGETDNPQPAGALPGHLGMAPPLA